MGHERLGVLPKTTPWSNIIDQMETLYESGDCSVADIAQEVLKNVRNRYEKLGEDVAIRTADSSHKCNKRFRFGIFLNQFREYLPRGFEPQAFSRSMDLGSHRFLNLDRGNLR